MYQEDYEPPQVPTRRVVYPPGVVRPRYAMLRERGPEQSYLSYALVFIFLFQTLLLGFVTLMLGIFVIFNIVNMLSHNQDGVQLALALTRIAPLADSANGLNTPMPPTVAPAAIITDTPTATSPAPPPTEPPQPQPEPPTPFPPPTQPVSIPESPLPAPPNAAAPELQFYASQVSASLNGLTEAVNRLRDFAQSPNLNDPQWVANVTGQLNLIRSFHSNLTTIQPPPLIAGQHSELLNAMNVCQAAVDAFQNSLNSRDPNSLNGAVSTGQNCFAQLPAAVQQVQEALRAANVNP